MSEMVRVPKAVFERYWHSPWSEVIAAAAEGADGLCVKGPKWSPWRPNCPVVSGYTNPNSGAVDRKRFDEDVAAWNDEQDTAFLYQATGWTWKKDTALLWQQNW